MEKIKVLIKDVYSTTFMPFTEEKDTRITEDTTYLKAEISPENGFR